MSNCYLCDICDCKECDLTIDRCTCRHRGETYKIVWMDNDDRPPQMICDYYVSHIYATHHPLFVMGFRACCSLIEVPQMHGAPTPYEGLIG